MPLNIKEPEQSVHVVTVFPRSPSPEVYVFGSQGDAIKAAQERARLWMRTTQFQEKVKTKDARSQFKAAVDRMVDFGEFYDSQMALADSGFYVQVDERQVMTFEEATESEREFLSAFDLGYEGA